MSDDVSVDVLLQQHSVPGMSYARLAGCNVVETGAAGFADLSVPRAANERTLFEAASLSKPVFAWLVMSLVEEGLVHLDRPLVDDGFDSARIVDKERLGKLTPRLILAHRSGLPNWSGDPRDPDRDTALAFSADPATKHTYSGEAYTLLQSFVEQKTGVSLQQLFEDRLGHVMPDSVSRRPFASDADTSRGYHSARNGEGEAVAPFERENAAYSLATTARDYGRFLSMVCSCDGLTKESYRDMLAVQTDEFELEEAVTTWRLGWEARTIQGRETVFHTGDNGNYISMALFFLDDGEGYVVFTNSETGMSFINPFLRSLRQRQRSAGR
ncbi:MAG: serine hydrolase domain-containing protein [Pseudomonadota bacterium]